MGAIGDEAALSPERKHRKYRKHCQRFVPESHDGHLLLLLILIQGLRPAISISFSCNVGSNIEFKFFSQGYFK